MLTTLALAVAGISALVMAYLAFIFWRDPVAAYAQTTHRPEQMPQVMVDRYLAFALLAAGALWFGHLGVIAFVMAVFAFLGFADAFIYARAGHSIKKHVLAGLAGLVASVIALVAQNSGVSL